MKLSEKEKKEHREHFQQMSPAEKADHILTYYKWPILLTVLALIIAISSLYRITTKKEPVLYLAEIGVVLGEDTEQALSSDFLDACGYDSRGQNVYLYRELYLSENASTENHSYAYASEIKILSSIELQKLDLVLMNRESYDILSKKGFLTDLGQLLEATDTASGESGHPSYSLVENTVVLADNELEVMLNEADQYEEETIRVTNAVCLTNHPLVRSAGLDGDLYLGVIANTPRMDVVTEYLEYLSAK